ncbi:hypothetical protein EDB86DRAFT_3079481 [Lactarius hatsudake]|nr:hypothetical protein EDB86DRAFT_3079481 [Lactarius hatsudake]
MEDPMFPALAVADGNNRVFTWRSLGAAIRTHILPAPLDPNMIRMSAYDPDGDEDETLAEINLTLTDEINRDVSSILQGWSTYRLQHPLELRKGHELPTTANEFNCMTKNILTALDAGAAAHDGETMIKGLTPQSWTRLTMATLSAILRGALRSPATLRTGARSLNGIDSFPLHKDVDHPLTEGGAIMLMCQQLEGLYRSNQNHPDKTYPDSYYDRLVTLLNSRMHQVPLLADTPAPAPLTEADRAQVNAAIREKLILDGLEAARVNPTLMGEIKEAVKAEIFANLNAEALTNIDDWRAIYKYEFTEAMHTAFEAQYPGIHPGKGKAKEAPPITHSQVVQEAQPHIKEVRLQVNARISSIHEEIKTSIANDDPFWKQGPLRETIATELRTATTIQVQQELEQELRALKTAAEEELNTFKTQLQFDQDQAHEALHREARAEYDSAKALFTSNLEEDVKEFKNSITASVKDWKDQFRTARNLSALKREARRFGVNLVPIDEESNAAQKILFNKYSLIPLEVDSRDLLVEPSAPPSRPLSPTSTRFITPPNLPSALPDPNVTPTPVRVKRPRNEGDLVYPPLHDHLFIPNKTVPPTPEQTRIPLPPPSPMEEDQDYALEVLTDHLHQSGPGIYASTHAPSSGTHPHSTVHTPSAQPQGAPLDAQSEEQPTDPSPATLTERPSTLEEPARAPQPPQTDSLAVILAAVNAAILGLEARLTGRLDAQDKRIETLSWSPLPPAPNSTTPAVKGNKAKGKEAVAAPPHPNTSIPASDAREISRPVPRIDDPASHDRPEDIITPGAAASAAQTTTTQPTVLKEAFQPPPDKVIHLNLDSKGKPTPSTTMPPSWAKEHPTAQPPAQKGTQPLSGVGKKPNHAKTSGNTEVTVNRHRGLDDPSLELVIHKLTPAEIIAETRTEIDRLTGGKIALLSGRWSKNPKKHIHNFVYTFKGQIPFRTLYPLRDVLVKPLMVGQLVPNDGWVNAQIRETHTSDASGNVYTNEQLEMELRRNPAFEEAIFCIAPHWQGSKHTVVSNPRGTVAFAYVDEDRKTTTQAQWDGVFLFNEKTKFIPVGDTPTIVIPFGQMPHLRRRTPLE